MQFRSIGSSDLRVSVAGLGCNNFGGRLDPAASRLVIDRALERGVNFFDTADSYGKQGGSERIIGDVLGARRKDVVIATKFGWPMDESGVNQGGSRAYVFRAVEASLRRLKTDWIDLYQFHRPDPATPIEETLGALEDLIRQGKIRQAGCSSFSADECAAAHRHAAESGSHGFVSTQDHYNLLTRDVEKTLMPELRRLGMSFLPYAPLASGFLTGKFRRDAPMPGDARITRNPKQANRYLGDESWRIIEDLADFSARRGKSLLDLAVAWVASRDPVCSVIAGAMTPDQVDVNVAALEWHLSDEEITEIDTISTRTSEASDAAA